MIRPRTVTWRYKVGKTSSTLFSFRQMKEASAQVSDYFKGQKHKKVLKLHSQVIGFYAPVPLARAFLSMVL